MVSLKLAHQSRPRHWIPERRRLGSDADAVVVAVGALGSEAKLKVRLGRASDVRWLVCW
jgi:hypothetical protein